MNETPQVLLEHYLKQLRLPTMVREYPKLAEQLRRSSRMLRHLEDRKPGLDYTY